MGSRVENNRRPQMPKDILRRALYLHWGRRETAWVDNDDVEAQGNHSTAHLDAPCGDAKKPTRNEMRVKLLSIENDGVESLIRFIRDRRPEGACQKVTRQVRQTSRRAFRKPWVSRENSHCERERPRCGRIM